MTRSFKMDNRHIERTVSTGRSSTISFVLAPDHKAGNGVVEKLRENPGTAADNETNMPNPRACVRAEIVPCTQATVPKRMGLVRKQSCSISVRSRCVNGPRTSVMACGPLKENAKYRVGVQFLPSARPGEKASSRQVPHCRKTARVDTQQSAESCPNHAFGHPATWRVRGDVWRRSFMSKPSRGYPNRRVREGLARYGEFWQAANDRLPTLVTFGVNLQQGSRRTLGRGSGRELTLQPRR